MFFALLWECLLFLPIRITCLNDKYWHVNDNGIIVCTINGVVEFKVQLNEGGKQSV